MRNILFVILFFTAFNFISAKDVVSHELKWERIYGWKNKNTKAYVDVKSLHKHREQGKDYNTGMVLFHSDESTEVSTPDGNLTVNMYASYFIADCETSRIATISDFYFNIDHLPVNTDEPLVSYDYSDNIQTVAEVEKTDPILTTLCPTYI